MTESNLTQTAANEQGKITPFPQRGKKAIGCSFEDNIDGASNLALWIMYYTTLVQPEGSGIFDFLLKENGIHLLADAIRNSSDRKTRALINFMDVYYAN